MEYWVYENWTHNKAIIHRAECGYCKYGKGVRETFGDNGRWLGPYKTKNDAELKAKQTKRKRVASCLTCSKT